MEDNFSRYYLPWFFPYIQRRTAANVPMTQITGIMAAKFPPPNKANNAKENKSQLKATTLRNRMKLAN